MGGAKEELMRFTVLNELAKTDQMSTADAIQLLNVSESTVRRLFAKLEACHDVIRVYGGIRANRSQNSYQYDRFYSHEQEAKSVIGNIAGNLVANSDCIFIDCGTTTVHMVQRLVERMQSGELHNISIVTNSLVNLELLAPHCKAILAGGIYTPERKSFAGYLSERFITQFHFNKSFIGVDGFTFEEGFATADPDFARLSGAAATAADETFVLMDSSKIGRRSFVVYDKYVRIHKIITDSHVKAEDLERFKENGIDVFIGK